MWGGEAGGSREAGVEASKSRMHARCPCYLCTRLRTWTSPDWKRTTAPCSTVGTAASRGAASARERAVGWWRGGGVAARAARVPARRAQAPPPPPPITHARTYPTCHQPLKLAQPLDLIAGADQQPHVLAIQWHHVGRLQAGGLRERLGQLQLVHRLGSGRCDFTHVAAAAAATLHRAASACWSAWQCGRVDRGARGRAQKVAGSSALPPCALCGRSPVAQLQLARAAPPAARRRAR